MESKKDIKATDTEVKDVKAAAEKTAAKVTEVKKEGTALDKTASKVAEKATEGKAAKIVAKNASIKKTSAKNESAKKIAASKAVDKKADEEENSTTLFIQYSGKEISQDDIMAKIYEDSGKKSSSVKSLEIYVKPEEGSAYYVINKKVAGRVEL